MTDLFTPDGGNVTLPEPVPEIYLGTVTDWDSSGIEVTLDGESESMTKRYRQLLTGRAIPAGSRVAVMKLSGTYVVLGQISNPLPAQNPANLASGAALASAVSKINEILTALRAVGVFLNEE